MKNWLQQNRRFLVFVLCFGFFRLAVADWNPIPSGSMRPTLLEGDVVLVNRLAYDFKLPLTDISVAHLGEPQRGDVVTFSSPSDGVRLIKRLVGLPGEVLEMRNEVLYINGEAARYSEPRDALQPLPYGGTTEAIQTSEQIADKAHTVQFLPAISAKRNFGPITVPQDNYFFLGDNRDDSADSRYIGMVPRKLLLGRAHHILVSADIQGNWLPRLERIGNKL